MLFIFLNLQFFNWIYKNEVEKKCQASKFDTKNKREQMKNKTQLKRKNEPCGTYVCVYVATGPWEGNGPQGPISNNQPDHFSFFLKSRLFWYKHRKRTWENFQMKCKIALMIETSETMRHSSDTKQKNTLWRKKVNRKWPSRLVNWRRRIVHL